MMSHELFYESMRLLVLSQVWHNILDHIYIFFALVYLVSVIRTHKRLYNRTIIILSKLILWISIWSNGPSHWVFIITAVTQNLKWKTNGNFVDPIIWNDFTILIKSISHFSIPFLHYLGHDDYALCSPKFNRNIFSVLDLSWSSNRVYLLSDVYLCDVYFPIAYVTDFSLFPEDSCLVELANGDIR